MKIGRYRWAGSIAFLLLAWAVVTPAQARARTAGNVERPPEGKYLFVELWVEVSGTGNLPPYIIDFPGYRFDANAGTLKPFFTSQPSLPALSPNSWGALGQGESRSGAAGGGIRSNLGILPTIPYTTSIGIGDGTAGPYYEHLRSAAVVLREVAADGTIDVVIDGKAQQLTPGAQWQKTVGADLVSTNYNGHYDVVSTVTNYGWQDRAKFDGPRQFAWVPLAGR